MKYCENCKQQVTPEKKVGWILFIVITILTAGIWLIIYPLYYFSFKRGVCPKCNSTNWKERKSTTPKKKTTTPKKKKPALHQEITEKIKKWIERNKL